MRQKVHSVSYLAKAEFEFKNGVYDLVALPTGAEVVNVSVSMVSHDELMLSGSINVGFKDSRKNYFLALKDNIPTSVLFTSDKYYTATSNKVVAVEVAGVNSSDNIKGVLRVLYFLPSVIEVEY
ncbi:hypothetical protein MPG08_04985 [Helicobacter pylori]|uniref:hypothetical protein n=1 Tax=Helicobacter pylori TaxID=210 RepID=UPI001FD0EDFE|nr:hypothetical protein [Helicobacter pylori]UOR27434.1 hypothetical protein MPG08_04985 [Helicobacter pylori]